MPTGLYLSVPLHVFRCPSRTGGNVTEDAQILIAHLNSLELTIRFDQPCTLRRRVQTDWIEECRQLVVKMDERSIRV